MNGACCDYSRVVHAVSCYTNYIHTSIQIMLHSYSDADAHRQESYDEQGTSSLMQPGEINVIPL